MTTMQASLYDQQARAAMVRRIQALHADSPRKWGKMTPAQMLAHCRVGFEVALGERQLKRAWLGLLVGWFAKRVALGDKPLPKNLPTGPEFLIRAPRAFEVERHALLEVLERFGAQPAQIGQHPHPFFGALTAHEHDRLQWRHLDHHLSQFT